MLYNNKDLSVKTCININGSKKVQQYENVAKLMVGGFVPAVVKGSSNGFHRN